MSTMAISVDIKLSKRDSFGIFNVVNYIKAEEPVPTNCDPVHYLHDRVRELLDRNFPQSYISKSMFDALVAKNKELSEKLGVPVEAVELPF